MALPPFELARGAGEGGLVVERHFKVLPDDPVVFVVGAYPEPD